MTIRQPRSLSKYWARCLSLCHGQQSYNGLLLFSRVVLKGQPIIIIIFYFFRGFIIIILFIIIIRVRDLALAEG
jgi:hypothetical protein